MSETFNVITALCYGKDNECIEEIRDNARQSVVFDPESEVWLLGEWEDDE